MKLYLMKINPSADRYEELPTSEAHISRESVYARTEELALLAGRHCHEITKSDYERAKQELTGSSDPELQNLILY